MQRHLPQTICSQGFCSAVKMFRRWNQPRQVSSILSRSAAHTSIIQKSKAAMNQGRLSAKRWNQKPIKRCLQGRRNDLGWTRRRQAITLFHLETKVLSPIRNGLYNSPNPNLLALPNSSLVMIDPITLSPLPDPAQNQNRLLDGIYQDRAVAAGLLLILRHRIVKKQRQKLRLGK